MIYYQASLAYTLCTKSVLSKVGDGTDPDRVRDWAENISKISALAGLQTITEALSVFVYDANAKYMKIALVSRKTCQLQTAELLDFIESHIKLIRGQFGLKSLQIEKLQEISQAEFVHLTERGVYADFINTRYGRNILQCLDITDHTRNNNGCYYQYREEICRQTPLSHRSCLTKLKCMLADDSLREEIERIYDKNNKTGFWGHPVHYHIHAASLSSANSMMELLLQALYKNGRLSSFRKNIVDHVTNRCFNDTALTKIFESANGGVVVLFLNGESEDSGQYANANHAVVDYFERLIRQHHQNTLFMLIDIGQQATLSKNVIEQLAGTVDFIDIREGLGTIEDSMLFAKTLQAEHKFPAWNAKDFRKLLTKDLYRMSEVHDIYNNYCKSMLSDQIYQSYRTAEVIKVESDIRSRSSAYENLNRLIGLDNVKTLVNSIIAFSKMQSQRKKIGLPAGGNAPHMAFLGNPGSAKTTVARLLARILSDEQILQGDIFVECGRQDLVGKYVGWTAKQVEAKFREAKGGILFIDEAYALTDGRDGSFGDEAINTIVQQMENHRDDTIVIFAGYPDKMIKFLKKNEGLRSRIGFQLTFEDYTPNQLDEIMQKMAEDKCYELDEDAKAACHDVFCNAVRMKDFGNGRYVRNLLQKAIMNQANRIYAEAANGEAGKEDLMLLRAEDFRDIQETFWEYDHSTPIGFSV